MSTVLESLLLMPR